MLMIATNHIVIFVVLRMHVRAFTKCTSGA